MLMDEKGDEGFIMVDQEGLFSPRLVLQGVLNGISCFQPLIDIRRVSRGTGGRRLQGVGERHHRHVAKDTRKEESQVRLEYLIRLSRVCFVGF